MTDRDAPPPGRNASSAVRIPWRGWLQILRRTWRQILVDNVMIISAGVAFFFLLALVPALTSAATIFSLLADPATLLTAIDQARGLLPRPVFYILESQLDAIVLAQHRAGALSFTAVLSLVLSLWAAGAGVRAMMAATTAAYRERETRNPFTFQATALALTLVSIAIGFVAIILFLALPIALSVIELEGYQEPFARVLRWPIFLLLIAFGLAVTYRYGPSRRGARAKWITTGSLAAAVLWLAGSVLFTWYVETWANFEAVHGTLSAVVVLLLWFWFSAFIAIAGAELNAEMEHQTSVDTTIGPDRPMGKRGAYVADHVADGPES